MSDGTTKELVTAGAVKKVDETDTSAIQYALGTDMTTIPTEGWSKEIPTVTDAGAYYVFYKVVGDKNHGDAMQSEFPDKSGYAGDTYNKPAFSVIKVTIMGVVKAPEATNNLTYNGKAQELIAAGEAYGGTMQYKLGENGTYSGNIPTATNAGDYTVYYKVVSDDNHNDSDEDSVNVTISKRNVTLTSATASKEYDGRPLTNDTVTVSGDGFAQGEGAQYTVTGTRMLVGVSENEFEYKLNDNTLADNYNIQKTNGTLTVTNRNAKYEITLKANSGEYTYDGTEKTISGIKAWLLYAPGL